MGQYTPKPYKQSVVVRQQSSGPGFPPSNVKYFFSDLEVNGEKEIEGEYWRIRQAAYSYTRKFGKKILAIQTKTGALIIRKS